MGRVFSVLGFIHPLPPAGYSHLSQGESQLQQNITAPADCPPETGGTSEAEGVDGLSFLFAFAPSVVRSERLFQRQRSLFF